MKSPKKFVNFSVEAVLKHPSLQAKFSEASGDETDIFHSKKERKKNREREKEREREREREKTPITRKKRVSN